jgi:predicted rRNA methylase YqxC with S4 and FtsJ domains
LGSSRGGFGLYAKIFASQLVGIEISRQFEDQLKEVF